MSTDPDLGVRCHLVGGKKLPAVAGSEATICSAIEHAVGEAAPGVTYTAEIKVLSKSRLAASLTVKGHPLPEQKFAIMDSELNAGAIQRFAASLAQAVAEAAKTQK